RLVQHEVHFRKLGFESGDHLRQRVTRLSMRRRDGEAPDVTRGKFVRDRADAARVDAHAVDDRRDFLARLGETDQPLATANEELYAELLLERLDVFAHP